MRIISSSQVQLDMEWRLLLGWLSSECGLQVHPSNRHIYAFIISYIRDLPAGDREIENAELLYGKGAARLDLNYYAKEGSVQRFTLVGRESDREGFAEKGK